MTSLIARLGFVAASLLIAHGCASESGTVGEPSPEVGGQAPIAPGIGGMAGVDEEGSSGHGGEISTPAGGSGPELPDCNTHADCDDGLFCNGTERCDDGECTRRGVPCDAAECDEKADSCATPVVDDDGDGDPAGSDCDDDDPTRRTGAIEVCDEVDDDCDPATLGPDEDGDGFVSVACCNVSLRGKLVCGEDCDDDDAAIKPGAAESCNGADDDCDGSVDDAEPSSDALCSIVGQSCTSGSCQCPAGQTPCGGSCATLGGACSAGVGGCARSGTIACVGSGPACNAVAGNPSAEICDGIDNNCDGAIDEGTKVSCSADSDGDRYANDSSASAMCPDFARTVFGNCPVGYVAPSASLGVDCNAAEGSLYRLESTSSDAEGDGDCAGGGASTCVGVSAPAGRRFTSSCAAGSDCNDANSGAFATVSVRVDADGDGYCAGSSFAQCTSGSAPGGTRLASSCAGNDCNDGNGYANSTCSIGDGFVTSTVRKLCTIGPPPVQVLGVTTTKECPTGFSPSNVRTQVSSSSLPGGSCAASGTSAVTVACGGVVLGWVDCRIVADCVAN